MTVSANGNIDPSPPKQPSRGILSSVQNYFETNTSCLFGKAELRIVSDAFALYPKQSIYLFPILSACNTICMQNYLYAILSVCNTVCFQHYLHAILYACKTICMQYYLYAILSVFNTICMEYYLYAIPFVSNTICMQYYLYPIPHGGVAEWLRRSVSNHARSTRVGSNPVVGTTTHKPKVNSAVHPSEVGNWVLKSNSEGISTGHTLITANLKLKCFIQDKDSK